MNLKDYFANRTILATPPSTPARDAPEETSPAARRAAEFLAEEIRQSLDGDRQLVLFGDFDVDGTSSAAILFLFARLCGVERVIPYISRRQDGYGLTDKSLRRLKEEIDSPDDSTVILMDLGVNTIRQAEDLLASGYRVVCIDHHVPSPEASEEWQRLERTYGSSNVLAYDPLLFTDEKDRRLKCLSAAGLVYHLCMDALESNLSGIQDRLFAGSIEPRVKIRPDSPPQSMEAVLNTMSKITAIAQAADCMPFSLPRDDLPSGGRALTMAWTQSKGFEFSGPTLGGVKVLNELTGTASRIGWVIGPVLNAAGRLEDAYASFEMLTEVREDRARERLAEMQTVRQRVRGQTERAAESLDQDLISEKGRGLAILLRADDSVSAGVVGIGAARAADFFKAPALYLSRSVDDRGRKILKGSMRRGNTDFSCEEWILKLKHEKICFAGGGHPAAAGLALEEAELPRLLASAALQKFSSTSLPLHPGLLSMAVDYKKQIETFLPFGNNHESARMLIHGTLHEIRSLTWQNRSTGEREAWAYVFTISDPETKERAEVKVLQSSLSPRQLEVVQELDGLPIQVPIQTEIVVHDGLKLNSRYERTDLRIAEATDGEDKCAAFHFISPDDLNRAIRGESYNAQSVEVTADQATQDADARVMLRVDWDPSCHRRNFTLDRPPPWELEKRLTESQIEELRKFHGGKWDRATRRHLISWGVMSRMIEQADQSPLWRVEFSPDALRHYDELLRESADVALQKASTKPFEIPYLRPGVTPYGFQYADIRLYLQRLFALSNNDMGTGKTLEGACWGALRYVGATVDADFEVHVPQEDDDAQSNETARKKPVLYLTLKGVMGQYADELRRFIDLEVSTVTTSQVSKFLQDYQVTLDESGTGSFKKVVKVDDEALAAAPGKLFGGAALVVSTYDCIARNPWMISMMDWSGVCLDECHELKTPDAHKTTAVFGKHIDGSPLGGAPILAMSGTFTKNRPADWFVWARLTGADGDCYTAGSLSTARRTFDMRFDALTFERVRGRGGREYTQSRRGARPENGDELKTLMTPFLIRRLKTEIAEIPPVKTRVLRVPSSGVYVHLLSALITGRDLPSETQDILGRHGILAGDRLIDTDQDEDAGMSIRDAARSRNYDDLAQKLSMISSLDKSCGVVEMLKELGWTDPDEPVVIMGLHRAAVREAAERLRDAGETVITMTQEDSAVRRREKQEMFTRGDARIFLTSFGVGGTGLNLTRASKILAINLPFIDSYLAQGRDRCHRLGQTRTVEFVIAILSGSIDEATWGMIQNKGRANYATLSVDRVKTGELPRWATAAAANLAIEDEAENQLDIRGFRRTARR